MLAHNPEHKCPGKVKMEKIKMLRTAYVWPFQFIYTYIKYLFPHKIIIIMLFVI